jgi:hypothetical protein
MDSVPMAIPLLSPANLLKLTGHSDHSAALATETDGERQHGAFGPESPGLRRGDRQPGGRA